MRLVAATAAVLVSVFTLTVYSPSSAHAAPQTDNKDRESKTITIQRGDSLSKIAKEHDSTFLRLFYANKNIKDPDLIYPGDKLRIPHKDEKLEKRALPADTTSIPVAPATSAPAASSAPVAQRVSAPARTSSPVSGSVWDRLAACESGGNWSINTGNGFYGGLQFTLSSWQAVGGTGYPHQASKSEQISRAQTLQQMQGWGAWPACSAQLGLL